MTRAGGALVRTRIVHARSSPVRHSFSYRSTSWLIDIDNLPHLPQALRPFANFRAGDHFPAEHRPGDTLRSRLDDHLRAAGATPPEGPVTALLSPRVVGYVFNPLSVFWCHDADGALSLVVAEVHNTYGERHCYVVHPDPRGHSSVDKEFYVSPFNDLSGTYHLRLPEPDERGRVALSVTLHRPGQAPFVARLTGTATSATPAAIVTAQISAPLAPLMVAARIRWHGIALWARGLPIVPRPPHRHTTTFDDVGDPCTSDAASTATARSTEGTR